MNLEENLGYFFFDKQLLKRALTTQAVALEQATEDAHPPDQEADCLLGQAIFQTVVTELLIRTGYRRREDILHWAIAVLEQSNLARISQAMGIGFVVRLSSEEQQQQAYDHPEVLANTLQAVIGGIYFDGGYSAARATVQRLLAESFPD